MPTTLMASYIEASAQNTLKRRARSEHRSSPATRRRLVVPSSLVTCALIALLISSLALFLVPTPRASALASNEDGHVYILNNDLSGPNSITVFNREEDGSLQLQGTTSIGKDDAISLVSANGLTASTPSDTFPLEESLSSNSHFLYVLDSRLLLKPPELATLSGFQVNSDGSLVSVVNPANLYCPSLLSVWPPSR